MVGYDSQNKSTLEVKYICAVCVLILRDPVQLFCGHRYCKSCMHGQSETYVKCRTCKTVALRNKMFDDRGMKNDMEELNISCSLCPWNGIFKNYQGHLIKNHSNISTIHNMEEHPILQIQKLVNKLNEDLNNIQQLVAKIKRITSAILTCKISIEEQNTPKEILPLNQDHIDSYDGRLLFIVDDIQNKLNGIQSVVTSAPFYTSPNGYKMCVRIYFNGNGTGQSTHISVFLILLPGDYDALLEWPFNSQIIFCLHNMNNQQDHIIESFSPNTNFIYCQRPRADMHVGIGLPQFVPLSIIYQNARSYICNNRMYFKVMIRKQIIPRCILSHIMCIDPALPIYMQEELIRKEIEKNSIPSFKLTLTLKPQSLI